MGKSGKPKKTALKQTTLGRKPMAEAAEADSVEPDKPLVLSLGQMRLTSEVVR